MLDISIKENMKGIFSVVKSHPNSIELNMGKNKNIDFNFWGGKKVVYLNEGSVFLNRKKDSVILFKIAAPFIIGLDHIFSGSDNYYLTPCENISLFLLSHEDSMALFDKEKLWKDISRIMSYFIMLHEHRSYALAENRNIYEIICFHLQDIWELPKIERERISIFEYILKRHSISRSSVAKILKELISGGYIVTKRGILIDLKKLPSKF